MNYRCSISTILISILALVITACQAAGPQPVAVQPTALPLTGASASRLGAAALIMMQKSSIDPTTIVPVSAETGQPIVGAEPVSAPDMNLYAFSQDRSQMVFITGATAGCLSWCLHRLDLQAWKEAKPLDLQEVFGTWFPTPAFNPDGSRLAVLINSQSDPNAQVQLVDLTQSKVLQAVKLDGTLYQAAFTPQGSLALYGSKTSADGKNSTVFVALLDGSDLHTLWQQELSDVHYTTEETTLNLNDPSQGQYLIPAAVFKADGSRLYIATADQPTLVTVDFSARTVQSATIQPRAGLLERLMALGTSVVYAKMLNGIYRSGVLSQDGRTFYVLGTQTAAVKDSNGEYSMKTIPLGLQIIDTADGALLATFQTDASILTLSLDGKSLLLTGWWQDSYGSNNLAWTDVLDLAALKVTQHLDSSLTSTRLLDGSLAWLGWQEIADGSYELVLYRQDTTSPIFKLNTPGNGILYNWIAIP